MKNSHKTYSRDQLMTHVWGGNIYLDERTVDVQIRRLRDKLRPYGYHDSTTQALLTPQKLFSKKWLKCLLGTAGAWFLLDVAFYGNGVSSTLIMKTISPQASVLTHTLLSAGIFLCFAVPGYWFAAKYVDRLGRKPLQILGFFMMTLCYFGIACLAAPQETLFLFMMLFGISFFFVNFGPNSTTFLIPSEVYPTSIRATAHGLSAAIGKLGAFIGAFFLPLLLQAYGLSIVMFVVAGVAFLGVFTTLLIPEMKGQSLETLESVVTNV